MPTMNSVIFNSSLGPLKLLNLLIKIAYTQISYISFASAFLYNTWKLGKVKTLHNTPHAEKIKMLLPITRKLNRF